MVTGFERLDVNPHMAWHRRPYWHVCQPKSPWMWLL